MIHKTTRSILSVLLAALLLVTSIPLTPAFAGGGGAVSLQSESAEGRALEQDGDGVYQIGSAAELLKFAQRVNGGETTANAVLTADIDLSGICSEESDISWTLIGSDSRRYTGTFNGDGHTISGLYINSATGYQGLFGYVGSSGKIENLSVSGSVSVSGSDHVGGVVGLNLGTVINCAFSGTVTGTGDYVGGVVGYNSGSGGSVINCYNTGTVSGNRVGGVVGYNISSVTNCYNTGTVTGTDGYVGGVVGFNISSVENCHNIGAVSGNSYVGGVVGDNGGSVENCYNTGAVTGSSNYVGGVVGDNSSPVKNCYNTGAVSGSGWYVGGVVGLNSGSTMENCYNIGTVTGTDDYVGGVVGYNIIGSVTDCYFLQDTAEKGIGGNDGSGDATAAKDLPELCNALASDINTWSISPFYKHPVLKANLEGGDGTKEHPYEIKTIDQLKTFRDIVNDEGGNPNAHAKLMNNIDLSSVCGESLNGETSWEPIGNSSKPYTGTFDGAGYEISGLYIDSDATYAGLFGRIGTNGTVKNLTLADSTIRISRSDSTAYVGVICGYNDGTIQNCCNSVKATATVTGSSICVGGICGYNNYSGSITSCSNSGTVTGSGSSVTGSGSTANVGGICGENWGSIENCSNSGPVEGSYVVGGICGVNRGSITSGSITSCSNSGDVTGSGSVGGICGRNSYGTITNCSNSGSVTGNGDVGGICGKNGNGSSITNCYWLEGTAGAGVGSGDGTVTAKSDEQYASGEVAWLLNQQQTDKPWGQGSNDMPVLISNCPEGVTIKTPVCITIEIQNETTKQYGYTTAGSTLASYPNDYMFFEDEQYSTIIDKATKTFDEDTTIYAQAASTVTSIALNKNTLALYVNDTEQLTATVAPENADGTILWTSSDSTVATVDGNGSVHAVGAGTATITAAAASDSSKNAACTVTVTESVYGITADTTALDFGSVYTGYAQPAAQTVTLTNTGNQPVTLTQPASTNSFEVGTLSKTKLAAGDTATFTVQPKDKLPRGSYSEQITISGNDGASATLTATFTVKEPPYTGKYSYEIATDIGDNGAISVDRYATEGDKVTITVTPDEAYKLGDLSVTANGKDVELTANSDGTYTFTMPSADVKISATFAEDPDWTEPEEPATDVSDIFLDVAPNAWYKDAVQYAYDNGLMTGVSATEFAPEATTTRAMIVSILARLEGVTTAEAAGFADVDDEWYATAVNWAASVGVVNGYEDNTFRPNTAITREQLAAILMNYAAYKGEDVSNRASLATYTDQPSTWAEEAMQWAVAEGLISGVTNDQLQPQGNATRAQVAAILQRFLDK